MSCADGEVANPDAIAERFIGGSWLGRVGPSSMRRGVFSTSGRVSASSSRRSGTADEAGVSERGIEGVIERGVIAARRPDEWRW